MKGLQQNGIAAVLFRCSFPLCKLKRRYMPKLQFISKEPISKGWSGDKKYGVTTADGTKYLLRVASGEKSAGRSDMFRMQQKVAALGVPMCEPVEFWKLLALYISSNTLSSAPWAIPFGEGEVNTMLNRAKDVLHWYGNL